MSWWQVARAVWEVMKPTELNQGDKEWIEQQQREREWQEQHDQQQDHQTHDSYDYGGSHDTAGASGGDSGE